MREGEKERGRAREREREGKSIKRLFLSFISVILKLKLDGGMRSD